MDTRTHLDFAITPDYFQEMLSLHIKKCMNEHSRLRAHGIIREQEQDKLVELAKTNQPISFFINTDEKEVTLFSGILNSIEISASMNVREATIEAIGYTAQMDVILRSRSFQNQSMTYTELFDVATGLYDPNGVMDMVTSGATIGKRSNGDKTDASMAWTGGPIIQYKETDWEFIKRNGSHHEAPLVPADGHGKLRYYVGRPGFTSHISLDDCRYRIIKDLGAAAVYAGNGISNFDVQDAITYEVISDLPLELGTEVVFKGRKLYVYAIDTVLEGSLLWHTYQLRSEDGIKVRKAYNHRISGLSLFGAVTNVRNDLVKLSLDIDKNNPVAGEKWFAYSTVYSSPNGSGWYAMPEIGDRVRLACPDEDESNSFSASAVDLKASNPMMRREPSHKIMHTVHGKHLEFKPGQIEMRANNGTAIILRDNDGVYISSMHDVAINAKNDINISSDNGIIHINGNEIKLMSTQGGIVKLDENVIATGKEVKVQ